MFTVGRIVSILMLLAASGRHPYSYYTFLRIFVSATAAYGAIIAHDLKKDSWVWLMGAIAILFNPIIPIHLSKSTWTPIDIATAIVFVVSFGVLREQ